MTELNPQAKLQHLNLRDVWNLRKTNKIMNVHPQGHSRPNNQNTTQSFLDTHCHEIQQWELSDLNRLCCNDSQADVWMKYCENAAQHGNNCGGLFNVCTQCIRQNNQIHVSDKKDMLWNNFLSVCKTCQDKEQSAYTEDPKICTRTADVRCR